MYKILLMLLWWLTSEINFYSPELDVIVCHDRISCLHEMGHNLDHDFGDISQSDDFQIAVNIYLTTIWNYPQTRSSFSANMVIFPGVTSPIQRDRRIWSTTGEWGGFAELYASMYQWADGDINNLPEIFRKFYEEEGGPPSNTYQK